MKTACRVLIIKTLARHYKHWEILRSLLIPAVHPDCFRKNTYMLIITMHQRVIIYNPYVHCCRELVLHSRRYSSQSFCRIVQRTTGIKIR